MLDYSLGLKIYVQQYLFVTFIPSLALNERWRSGEGTKMKGKHRQ
jgi:hypothetical protein